jgi:hypothetical protein
MHTLSGSIPSGRSPWALAVCLTLATLHGYLRAPKGIFTTFDAPGAGTGPFQGTVAYNINPAGAIAGFYADASNVLRAFVRAPNGAATHNTTWVKDETT